jgi:integrase
MGSVAPRPSWVRQRINGRYEHVLDDVGQRISDASKATRWRGRYRGPDGKDHQKTFDRKIDAQAWVRQNEAAADRGAWIDPSAAKITFGEWWAIYVDEYPKRATTMSRDRTAANNWLLPHLKDLPLAKISPAVVRRVVDAMADAMAPSSARTFYGTLQAAMTAAVDRDIIARSPCRGIKLSSERRKDPRFLAMDELHKLANAMPDEHAPMVYIAGVLGLRFSEVAGLRVCDLDFLRRRISVVQTVAEVDGYVIIADVKTKMSRRTMSVPPELMEMLAVHLEHRGRPAGEDLVFVAPEGGPLRRNHWRKRVWLKARKKAGFDDLTFHGLRHSAVGFMIQLRTHPRVIQQRMGHASIRTTMDVYGSVLPEVDDEVTAGLGDLLRGHSAGTAKTEEVAESGSGPLTSDFNGGAEGSRTPGLLDATEAL